MNDIKSLEHPTLKVRFIGISKLVIPTTVNVRLIFSSLQSQVPYEIFNKKYRQAQKTLDNEVRQVQSVVNQIESGLSKENVPAEEITRLLGGMVYFCYVLRLI